MLNIPAAVNIRLRADDHQPEHHTGAGVVTPHAGVGLGRGAPNCHYQVMNPPKCLVPHNWHGRGAEDNIDREERLDLGGCILREEEAARGDLSESEEEDNALDNEIATALLCARGNTPTIDGNNTATITTAYTDGTGDCHCESV